MSRKMVLDNFATKTTRNDRFAQMSRQEQVIEQKKREIQARLQLQKEKVGNSSNNKSPSESKKSTKSAWKGNAGSKPIQSAINKSDSTFNVFSNDGSFLDHFKQLNDKKSFESTKTGSLGSKDKSREDRSYCEERTKISRWSKSRSISFDDSPQKKSRFSDISQDIEPSYFTSEIFANYSVQPPQNLSFPVTTAAPLLIPPPMSISVPPPQLGTVGALIAPPPPTIGINVPPPVISVQSQISVPPPVMQTVELTSIPAPNPIPVHTIPQPEPINALTIPPPAPLQLQNIPSPSPIRLNEIPNPKPLDLLNIPAPGEEQKINKPITDPDFIKNVPPPNKSVPPPNIGTVTELPNITIPPPNTVTSVPPPNQLLGIIASTNTVSTTNIPPLMAQPILPPPGMTIAMTVPPPVNVAPIPGPPPVLSQPPPLAQTNQIPPMNFPPPIQLPNVSAPPGVDLNAVCPTGSACHDAMESLGRMVAQCGSGIEDIVQQRSSQDPRLWFLFNKQSTAYQQYRRIVDQFRDEINAGKSEEYQPEDLYEPDNITDDESDQNKQVKTEDFDLKPYNFGLSDSLDRKRKRKSRWGEKVQDSSLVQPISTLPTLKTSPSKNMLTKLTRNDPGLIQYAISTYGNANISEEDWKKVEDHYKINLLYQDMVKKREEIEKLKRAGKNKYEYDSDEETDGGTWEHKLRMQEMEATQIWANELTRQAEGKHHIGDFLPPEELKKFMEKYSASKEGRIPNLSDYKEFKLKEDNIGFKMLQKLGWQEGQGLGSEGTGIIEPINKGNLRDQNQGLGLESQENTGNPDDEYDAYRKRMMLAYRFRPNPLNNPRRPYY